MTNLYNLDAKLDILEYDVSNEQSLESLNYWFNELNDKVETDKLILCLAGNKNDVDASEKKSASF